MSPVAHSGTATPPSNNAMTSNARNYTVEPVGNALAGGVAYGVKPGARKEPFRHIDDIVSVSVELDPYATLGKVLEAGDAHMQQAITYKAFGRPDLALQEYIKAFTIAVDKVPKHKDYPSLKSDRGDLNRLYHALKVKITNNGVAYDKLKEMIKEDNLRSGVRPKKAVNKSPANTLSKLPGVPSNEPSRQSIDNHDTLRFDHMDGNARNSSSHRHPVRTSPQFPDGPSLGRKPRPIVHPKPQSLLGNSIKPVLDKASPDLAARFAKLRDSQGPQNNSSPPPSAKPTGPRAMPPSHRAPLSIRSSLPAMPKIPDAVYSPARGTVTSEAANLPSSTPRGMFSRTNSVVAVSSTSSRNSMDSIVRAFNKEQFVTAHTYGDSQAPLIKNSDIPTGELITVKELLRYMEDPSVSTDIRILLIDVRDRQFFDEGHIMSPNTICLDPTVLVRQNISVSDIADSMVLAPTSEKLAFEQCDEADLVVFYDQNSESIPQKITSNAQGTAIFNLYTALVHYSFPKQLTHTPKLLVGGLDAWVDEQGYQSLQISKTQTIVSRATTTSTGSRQRLGNRTLKPEEIDTFEAMIGQDENGDFDYTKSRDDFMRRYPSIREPESMVSKEKDSSSTESTGSGGEEFLKDMTPTPPVRPKPSVARTRYSGLESAEEHSPGGLAMMAAASSNNNGTSRLTGLLNPGNWCYANSCIQALLACPGFIDYFLDPQWPTNYRPNVPPSNPAYNQLMCKVLGNLFQWLSQRNFTTMRASTLMHYLRTIHTGYRTGNDQLFRFGDANQHDADEFVTFLFGQLEAETSIKLTMNILPQLDTTQVVGFVAASWANRQSTNIISQNWYCVQVRTLTCNRCGAQNHIYIEEERLNFTPPDRVDGNMEELVQGHFAPEPAESECDSCHARDKRMQIRIVRLPPLLRVVLQRTDAMNNVKNNRPCTFPLTDFDLANYAFSVEERRQIANVLGGNAAEGFDCSTKYDLFATVCHNGASMNSGHYVSFVMADNGTWTFCNDSTIESNLSPSVARRRMYRNDRGFTPVVLWYRRQDQARR
ncbi:hypothetical protein F5Y10DRAFT_230401 [Nemania abortiva]|nr:hypothetical protein F5Y10DRAFT_230401 [Nemania abortiva]